MNKRYEPQILKVKAVDRETYTIRFVLSTGAVDRHGEVIDQKGWRLENYKKNPVVLWGHDQSKFPIGKGSNITNDGQLEMDVTFAYKQNPEAAVAFELCADEFLNAGSVGFMNTKWSYDEETDILTLLENELYEFSIVNVPANPEAIAKAIEGMEGRKVEKRVIDKVKEMREAATKKEEARFKDLGEEVKEEEEAPAEAEEGDEPDEQTPVGEEVETQTAAEGAEEEVPAEDEVKGAIETLCKASPTALKEAVEVLTGKVKVADTTKVEPTPARQGRVKKYSVHSINRVARILASSEAK